MDPSSDLPAGLYERLVTVALERRVDALGERAVTNRSTAPTDTSASLTTFEAFSSGRLEICPRLIAFRRRPHSATPSSPIFAGHHHLLSTVPTTTSQLPANSSKSSGRPTRAGSGIREIVQRFPSP